MRCSLMSSRASGIYKVRVAARERDQWGICPELASSVVLRPRKALARRGNRTRVVSPSDGITNFQQQHPGARHCNSPSANTTSGDTVTIYSDGIAIGFGRGPTAIPQSSRPTARTGP